MLKLTMTCSVITELIMSYETLYATLDLKRFGDFFFYKLKAYIMSGQAT